MMHGIPATWLRGLLGLVVAVGLVFGSVSAQADVPFGKSIRAAGAVASIYGTDDRKPVQDTTRFPYSAIGLVQLQVGSEVYIGTGVMIGRFLALTCGHVAAGTDTLNADSVVFIPGENGGTEPFGRANVVRVIPTAQWAASADDNYDIAILVLDTAIGDQTGYFQIAVQPNSFFDNVALITTGYPTDLGMGNPYTVSGRSYGMDGNLIIHDLDSEPGQSGSPVWYGGLDHSARLVGLLEGSYMTMTGVEGIAARIDQQTANWIEKYLAIYYDNPQGISGPVTADPSTSMASLCGLGSMQALLGGTLIWTAAFVGRRQRMF